MKKYIKVVQIIYTILKKDMINEFLKTYMINEFLKTYKKMDVEYIDIYLTRTTPRIEFSKENLETLLDINKISKDWNTVIWLHKNKEDTLPNLFINIDHFIWFDLI